MLELKEMKLADFAAWLRAQPADIQFMEGRACATCPIAKWSGREVASYIFGMPAWASEFIDSFDERVNPTTNLTLPDALAVLSEIEAKFG